MKPRFHSEWSDSLREEGAKEGLEEMRQALFDLLMQKSDGADPEQRRAVESCRDPHRLRLWITEVAISGRFEVNGR